MPDTSKLEKLNRELEKSEKKLRKAINDEKALQHQLKQLTRKERTHRLCTRGGMLESFLQEPERLTDDDVMLLLKLIFHRQDTQELLKKLLEQEKSEPPYSNPTNYREYPQEWNQPAQSCGVMVSKACLTASGRSWASRTFFFLKKALSFDHIFSIGFKSGL